MEGTMSVVEISRLNQANPVTVFRLQERISLENFARLESITKAEYENGMRRLVLDLSETPSLTSTGVRAVVVMHKILSAGGGNPLKIAAAPPLVRDVLQIAGITQFIDLYDSVEEAAASY
jgi:anti-anti-sigma factor